MTDNIITPELVALDANFGGTTTEVITNLATLVQGAGRATSTDVLAGDALAREAKSDTGVPGGVAIPHCRSEAVTQPTLAFARLDPAVNFGGPDGDANLVFLIAAPAGGGKEHLKILSKLARALVKKDFTAALRSAATKDEIVELVLNVVNAAPKKTTAPAATTEATSVPEASESSAPSNDVTRIVAITACPTGIAHTYMAADSLTQTAEEMDGVELVVETQGSSAVTPVASEVIDAADAVIFATDVGVKDRERFVGKPVIESGVKRAINEPKKMIEEAVAASKNPNAYRVTGGNGSAEASADAEGAQLGWGKRIQQAVMTGVSYMVPFVAAGGLLLALGFLLGGYQVADVAESVVKDFSLSNLPGTIFTEDGEQVSRTGLLLYLGAVLFATGQAAMGFVVAALSGYIAYALAGRPGIAPGFVGGAISVTVGAGFIGGLITGIIAVVGLSMYLLLGRPLEALMTAMQDGLKGMSGSSAIVLGIILGLMMCFDLGGPVNKAAYLFATAGLSTGDDASLKIMATVMAAGMVPPIALSVATFVRKNLFTPAEQENGKSAWLLGLSFISEGAIPFAAADPLRVIPSMMLGGAVTGAISMSFGTTSRAPHGGLFVFFAISPFWAWLVAIVAGVIVSAAAVIAMKQFWPNKAVEAANKKAETQPVAA